MVVPMERLTQAEMFGMDEVDEFRTAKERYGTWPVTVWEVDHSDQMTRRMKQIIGDDAAIRAGSGSLGYIGSRTESIFSPAVASYLLNMYAPDVGICYDPFAGGGTRAIMAAKHGLRYVGVELRADECEAVRRRCQAAGVADKVTIINGDAREATLPVAASFLITCPPYFNLEVYDGGPKDLSMAGSYDEFLNACRQVADTTRHNLKPGSISCWVVGLHRDKDGWLLPMNHDIARVHREVGFKMKEEIILVQKNNGAIQRVGMFDKGNHKLIRVHEYVMVFQA